MNRTEAGQRLDYLRRELRAERMSYGELVELQELADYIEPGDVELLEAAGVPEFDEDEGDRADNEIKRRKEESME